MWNAPNTPKAVCVVVKAWRLTLRYLCFKAWMINKRHSSEARDEITYPFSNFNGSTVEVRKWLSNFIPHFKVDVLEQLERLSSENTPNPHPTPPQDYPCHWFISDPFHYKTKLLCAGVWSQTMNVTKSGTYVKSCTNYYIFIKIKSSVLKWPRKRSKCIISHYAYIWWGTVNNLIPGTPSPQGLFWHQNKKKSGALWVILTYLDIQRRPEHEVLSHDVKKNGKNSNFGIP